MRKILLSTLSILAFGFAVSAQDEVEIYEQGMTTDLSSGNGPLQVTVSTANEVSRHFEIKNISGIQKSWKITRKRINEIATWTDYMCWDICFTAGAMSTNPWTSPTSLTIADGNHQLLDTYVTPDAANPGTVTYRYYVHEDGGSYLDSVDVEITFVLDAPTISPEVNVSVSPNPATEYVSIKAGEGQNGTVRIVDVLGNVVFTESFTSSKKVNVSSFRNGIYFVIVEPSNGRAVNKKVIIRH